MKARVWEISVAAVGLLFAAFLLVGGTVAEGVVAASLTVVWFVGRLTIIDSPGVAGGYVQKKANVAFAQSVGLGLILLAVVGVQLGGALAGWGRDVQGRLLFLSLIGLMFLLKREIESRMDVVDRYRLGAASEKQVGAALAPLRDEGWEIIDDWCRDDRRANVDHAVRGPGGVFAIETKSGGYRSRQLGQAINNAIWLKGKWHERWVTAVVCVDDKDQQPVEKGLGRTSAWVVDWRDLPDWLRSQESRSRPVPSTTSTSVR
jgi:hypothetical protein